MMTGLSNARGELVFLIDSDLEEEPELLDAFQKELKATGADVIYGVQEKRKGKLFERVSGTLFFKILNTLMSQPIPENVITGRLMTRQYVEALLRHQEREMVLMGLWGLTGFRQVPLTVKKHSKDSSTYSIGRKVSHAVNAVTSFSNKPLVLIFYLGCFILLVSSITALDLIIRKVLFGALLIGWPSLMVSIWLLGGMTIFCLGVIGIYLAKIFIEVKQRPYTIVKHIYEHRDPVVAESRVELVKEED
jgi:putative glycosyltransferase